MNSLILYASGVMLLLISAASLLFKNEGIRGAGRVLGGVGWLAVGVFLLEDSATRESAYAWLSWGVILSGLATVCSGLRKFIRRNSTQI
jgi:hypothetical protein